MKCWICEGEQKEIPLNLLSEYQRVIPSRSLSLIPMPSINALSVNVADDYLGEDPHFSPLTRLPCGARSLLVCPNTGSLLLRGINKFFADIWLSASDKKLIDRDYSIMEVQRKYAGFVCHVTSLDGSTLLVMSKRSLHGPHVQVATELLKEKLLSEESLARELWASRLVLSAECVSNAFREEHPLWESAPDGLYVFSLHSNTRDEWEWKPKDRCVFCKRHGLTPAEDVTEDGSTLLQRLTRLQCAMTDEQTGRMEGLVLVLKKKRSVKKDLLNTLANSPHDPTTVSTECVRVCRLKLKTSLYYWARATRSAFISFLSSSSSSVLYQSSLGFTGDDAIGLPSFLYTAQQNGWFHQTRKRQRNELHPSTGSSSSSCGWLSRLSQFIQLQQKESLHVLVGDEARRCLRRIRKDSTLVILCILGPPYCGKTTFIQTFLKQLQGKDDGNLDNSIDSRLSKEDGNDGRAIPSDTTRGGNQTPFSPFLPPPSSSSSSPPPPSSSSPPPSSSSNYYRISFLSSSPSSPCASEWFERRHVETSKSLFWKQIQRKLSLKQMGNPLDLLCCEWTTTSSSQKKECERLIQCIQQENQQNGFDLKSHILTCRMMTCVNQPSDCNDNWLRYSLCQRGLISSFTSLQREDVFRRTFGLREEPWFFSPTRVFHPSSPAATISSLLTHSTLMLYPFQHSPTELAEICLKHLDGILLPTQRCHVDQRLSQLSSATSVVIIESTVPFHTYRTMCHVLQLDAIHGQKKKEKKGMIRLTCSIHSFMTEWMFEFMKKQNHNVQQQIKHTDPSLQPSPQRFFFSSPLSESSIIAGHPHWCLPFLSFSSSSSSSSSSSTTTSSSTRLILLSKLTNRFPIQVSHPIPLKSFWIVSVHFTVKLIACGIRTIDSEFSLIILSKAKNAKQSDIHKLHEDLLKKGRGKGIETRQRNKNQIHWNVSQMQRFKEPFQLT